MTQFERMSGAYKNNVPFDQRGGPLPGNDNRQGGHRRSDRHQAVTVDKDHRKADHRRATTVGKDYPKVARHPTLTIGKDQRRADRHMVMTTGKDHPMRTATWL